MDLTLVIMAAGMGSRFGGIKQIEPISPNGEVIMDYSVYDAVNAGFNKVVFVIKKDIEQAFKEAFFDRISKKVNAVCVFQELESLPKGVELPEGREKPWGTAHAVLAAREVVSGPFAVINADDFYGAQSFKSLADFLKIQNGAYHYCMSGYKLQNTLSETGYVSRGVCETDQNGDLIGVTERVRIEKQRDKIVYIDSDKAHELAPDTVVSMNCWGFTTEIFSEVERMFPEFISQNQDNLLKAEFYLPTVVSNLLGENKAKVHVFECNEKWYGFTYKEDKQTVHAALRNMIAEGKYPEKLY